MVTVSEDAPLDDPDYVPDHQPTSDGGVPLVVGKWGPRSQVRWFNRFRGQIAAMPHKQWDQFFVNSEKHRGLCCNSCLEDQAAGYDTDLEWCCCQSYRE